MLRIFAVLIALVVSSGFAHADTAWDFYSKRNTSVRTVGAVIARGVNAVDIAMRHIGKNPTGMSRLWCARYVGMVERKAGRKGTGSDLARSYEKYGKAVGSIKQVRRGDIVVLGRGKRGGHVGYATGRTVSGKIELISGNSGGQGPGRRVVSISRYPVERITAIRRPA